MKIKTKWLDGDEMIITGSDIVKSIGAAAAFIFLIAAVFLIFG